jgi:ABC-type nitrate/sulfonate/bicarbonate transport system substrate-binding protein
MTCMISRIGTMLLAVAVAFTAFHQSSAQQRPLQKITINYPTRTGQSWPLYIAKEGGYYQKYGLDADIVFGTSPTGIAMVISQQAAMTPYTLEQAMQAASKDGSLVMVGSPFKKSLFALMANKNIRSMKDLSNKRVGVTTIGDAPHQYTIGLIARAGLKQRDVQWVPLGGDVSSRAAALLGNRVDATMLTAPVYFKFEQDGYNNLGNISDYDDIYAPSVYLMSKAAIKANPQLPELIIKAHAEAIKRFYDDKQFAIKAYMAYDKQNLDDVARIYDHYAKVNTYERVPYILAPAVKYILDNLSDPQSAPQMRRFDYRSVIDPSVLDRIVKEGFFEKLYGPGIKSEIDAKSKLAYR